MKTYNNFILENSQLYTKKEYNDPEGRGYIHYLDYGRNHPDYPNGLIVFNGSFVHPNFRGQGLFTTLLNGFLSTIPKGTTFQVPVNNKVLRNMFLRMGFERVKQIEYWGKVSSPTWAMQWLKESYQINSGLYHYTSFESCIKILESGELRPRDMSVINKYASGMAGEDYGYISFTEDPDFEDSVFDVPKDVRFVFDRTKLEQNFNLVPFSYDEEKQSQLGDVDDLAIANEEWYGDESELRIYQRVELKPYIIAVQRIEGDDEEQEEIIQNLCKNLEIKYQDYKNN